MWWNRTRASKGNLSARPPRLLIGLLLAAAGSAAAPAMHAPGGYTVGETVNTAMADQNSAAESRTAGGKWIAERESSARTRPRVWVHLLGFDANGRAKTAIDDGGWVPLADGEPAGMAKGREVRFEVHRDAGVLSFAGTFDGSGPGAKGRGSFVFTGDPRYALEMERLGPRAGSGQDQLQLAWRDVSLEYVRDLQALGYGELTRDQLLELRARGVTADSIRELAALGYRDLPASRLVELSMYDVTPAFIGELAALGYEGLSAQELVDCRIQNVTSRFIRELGELGYRGLPARTLIELRIQGVDAEFVRELQHRGHGGLSPSELIDARLTGSLPGERRRARPFQR
jgi:hypothetical protein